MFFKRFLVAHNADEAGAKSFYRNVFQVLSDGNPGAFGPGFLFDKLEDADLLAVAAGAQSQAESGGRFAFAGAGVNN